MKQVRVGKITVTHLSDHESSFEGKAVAADGAVITSY